MNAARAFVALVGTHTLIGAGAWLNGYITGRLMERRGREVLDLCDRVQGDIDDFIDLLIPVAVYDWQREDSGVA